MRQACIKPEFKLLNDDNTINSIGQLIFGIFCSLAENEAYLIKERLKRGKEKAKSDNRRTGGRIIYGYLKSSKSIIVNEHQAQIIKIVLGMADMPISQIMHKMRNMGIWEDTKMPAYYQKIKRIIHFKDVYAGKDINYPSLF